MIVYTANNMGIVRKDVSSHIKNLDISTLKKIFINTMDIFANPNTFLEMNTNSYEFVKDILTLFMKDILNSAGGY